MSLQDWILTTHVGSLPRPTKDTPLCEVVRLQDECGIDVVNDGEWARENYIADLLQRIDGIGMEDNAIDGAADRPGGFVGAAATASASGCSCVMPCASDMKDVPLYAARFSGANGLITLNPKRPALSDVVCTRFPRYRGAGAAAQLAGA